MTPAIARGASWGLLILALATLVPFLYAFGFCYPYGDDFDDYTRAMLLFDLPGAVYEVGRDWLTWGGRYTSRFLAVFFSHAVASPILYGGACLAVFSTFAILGYRFVRRVHPSRGLALTGGIFFLLLVACCHGAIGNFYLYTDSLTIVLQVSLYGFFLTSLLHFWQHPEGTIKYPAVLGILAIGVYEYAAIATVLSASGALLLAGLQTRSGEAADRRKRRRRPLFWLCALLLAAMLFAFLAPGKFLRMAALAGKHLSSHPGMGQEVLEFAKNFAGSRWIWAAVFFSLWLAAISSPLPPGGRRSCWIPVGLGLGLWACFMGAVLILHRLSGVPVLQAAKTPASLAVFSAIALGFVLYFIWRALLAKLPPPAPVLCCMIILGLGSANFMQISASAASGNMLNYGRFMQYRQEYLARTGIAPASFGILAEIRDPDARKHTFDPSLPRAVVQQWSWTTYPFTTAPGLGPSITEWPNTWASKMFGLQSVQALPPDPNLILAQIGRENSLELKTPDALSELAEAWLVAGECGPNATFRDLCLVMRWKGQARPVEVLVPQPPSVWRLLPLPLQSWLAAELPGQRVLHDSWRTSLASITYAVPISCDVSGLQVYPLGWIAQGTSWPVSTVFIRYGDLPWQRLMPPV